MYSAIVVTNDNELNLLNIALMEGPHHKLYLSAYIFWKKKKHLQETHISYKITLYTTRNWIKIYFNGSLFCVVWTISHLEQIDYYHKNTLKNTLSPECPLIIMTIFLFQEKKIRLIGDAWFFICFIDVLK